MTTTHENAVLSAACGETMTPADHLPRRRTWSGAYGEKVTDPQEVGPAIQRGLQAVREGAPAVLDMWMPKHVTGEV